MASFSTTTITVDFRRPLLVRAALKALVDLVQEIDGGEHDRHPVLRAARKALRETRDLVEVERPRKSGGRRGR